METKAVEKWILEYFKERLQYILISLDQAGWIACMSFWEKCADICWGILPYTKEDLPYSGKVWPGKVWRINRSDDRLLIVSTNLVGFSLANHRWFAKFAKLSPPPNFPTIWYFFLVFTVSVAVSLSAYYF